MCSSHILVRIWASDIHRVPKFSCKELHQTVQFDCGINYCIVICLVESQNDSASQDTLFVC